MNASRTARARARAELTAEITRSAREQLREVGAAGLSLRAVARDLGLASSAVYRYFSSRDELLTALITDAYAALADAVESAASEADPPRARWRACAGAIRDWARRHPHEYALLYGSPVPGYHAPASTTAAAVRTAQVLGSIIAAGRPGAAPGPNAALTQQVRLVADAVAPGADPTTLALGLVAWTQVYGMVGFELFGQFANTLDPADEFFDYAVERGADLIGLPPIP